MYIPSRIWWKNSNETWSEFFALSFVGLIFALFDCLDAEDGGSKLLRNCRNCLYSIVEEDVIFIASAVIALTVLMSVMFLAV
jgi:hypothetical protein